VLPNKQHSRCYVLHCDNASFHCTLWCAVLLATGVSSSMASNRAAPVVSMHAAALLLLLLLSVLAAAHTPLPDTKQLQEARASNPEPQQGTWTAPQHGSTKPSPAYPASKCVRRSA
jgi:hypothetical protein